MRVRNIFIIFLSSCFLSNICLADCDFSKGISPLPDGNYKYSAECHLKVGQLVQDNSTKDKQIVDLKTAIDLKDLALQKSDQRAQLWMDTSFKLEDNIQKIDSFKNTNQWVYFGLGVLTMFAATYAASQSFKN